MVIDAVPSVEMVTSTPTLNPKPYIKSCSYTNPKPPAPEVAVSAFARDTVPATQLMCPAYLTCPPSMVQGAEPAPCPPGAGESRASQGRWLTGRVRGCAAGASKP